MNDIHFLPAYVLLEKIIHGELKAADIVDHQLERIRELNPRINAVVTIDEEGARERAKQADKALLEGRPLGPLHGLPITVKDNIEVAGMRATAGHKKYEHHVPERDALVVKRLKDAGAIVLGKTNLPPFGSDAQTINPLFGRTNNPWDLELTPGGSSGGGAAVVASGLSYADICNDILGSIRIPAHYCGVYGFAPSLLTVPGHGSLPEAKMDGRHFIGRLGKTGILARSAKDIPLIFSAMAGPSDEEPYIVPLISEGARKDPAAVTKDTVEPATLVSIGWTDSVPDIPVSRELRDGINSFAGRLAGQGFSMEKVKLDQIDLELARKCWGSITFSISLAKFPSVLKPLVSLVTRTPIRSRLKRYLEVEEDRLTVVRQMELLLSRWDAFVCPVTATAAFPHLELKRYMGPQPVYKTKSIDVDGTKVSYGLASVGMTSPFNVTGNPVVVVPIGITAEGLPYGVQLVGKRWQDLRLLRVAARIEDVLGELPHPPGY